MGGRQCTELTTAFSVISLMRECEAPCGKISCFYTRNSVRCHRAMTIEEAIRESVYFCSA
jgi:hypothetical protein